MTKITNITTYSILILTSLWWFYINIIDPTRTVDKDVFSNTYGLICLIGGGIGILASIKWGGIKSIIGKSLLMFALGLIVQEFGQITYSYYLYVLHYEELPYPSFGDFLFLMSTPLYTYGTYLFLKATGATFSLKTYSNKIVAIIVPLVILAISKYLFLSDYVFDLTNPLVLFFDIAYPILQAFYISIGLLAYIFSLKYLGGYLKTPILIIIISLLLHYSADYVFTYQFYNDLWAPGEISEYLYFLAYSVMSIGLLQFNSIIENIKGGVSKTIKSENTGVPIQNSDVTVQ